MKFEVLDIEVPEKIFNLVIDTEKENIKLQSDNQKMKDALEMYANKYNWKCPCGNENGDIHICDQVTSSDVEVIGQQSFAGKRARAVLKEIEGEK